jgi:ribosomal protein L11 methyltransferase
MDYIKITFTKLQSEQREILIAQLADAGYEGFEETDHGLDAFINKESYDESLLKEITFKYQVPFTCTSIAETNWNKIWESNFQPVVVGDHVAIRADFHEPIPNMNHEILITPKMSFGTGHHATTYMMIQLMQEIDFTNKTVLDFGTGTGVLAILAEMSGADAVLAIDNDNWSIENAAENIKKNNCEKIALQKASDPASNIRFDVILANINKNVILDNVKMLQQELKNDGLLLLSGLLEADKEDIRNTATELHFILKKELLRDNWIALQFVK